MKSGTLDRRQGEVFTDTACRVFFYLGMAWDGLFFRCGRIDPHAVGSPFSKQSTAVFPKMLGEVLPFQASCSSLTSSLGDDTASSLLVSKMNSMHCFRSARHSSIVSPCPTAVGTSAQVAQNPVSPSSLQSCSNAVKTMLPTCHRQGRGSIPI